LSREKVIAVYLLKSQSIVQGRAGMLNVGGSTYSGWSEQELAFLGNRNTFWQSTFL